MHEIAKTERNFTLLCSQAYTPFHMRSQDKPQLVLPRGSDSTLYCILFIVRPKLTWYLGWPPILITFIVREDKASISKDEQVVTVSWSRVLGFWVMALSTLLPSTYYLCHHGWVSSSLWVSVSTPFLFYFLLCPCLFCPHSQATIPMCCCACILAKCTLLFCEQVSLM